MQRKMNVFAISNSHISGGGQLFPTKFGMLVVPPPVCTLVQKYGKSGYTQFCTIREKLDGKTVKMAIFATLNPHISKVGLPSPTTFGKLAELQGLHFSSKACWDRVKHFGAIDDKIYDESEKTAIFATLNSHVIMCLCAFCLERPSPK